MYLIQFYNNGGSVCQQEEQCLQEAFEAAVGTMKKMGYSACYIYSEDGGTCLHLTYSTLFGEVGGV